jgi:iron complex transport system ATP-binding protein
MPCGRADRAYLLRQGARLGDGAVGQILGRAQLEALYGTPVQLITDADGQRSAFIPG